MLNNLEKNVQPEKMALIEKDPQNPELYEYAEPNNPFMIEAAKNACQSNCGSMQTGAVIVENSKIIASGYNSVNRQPGLCPRVEQNLPSGTGYELCPDCGPDYHAEADAVRNAQEKNINLKDADLYLWGHWWACLPCWRKMLSAGISQVFLIKGARQIFNHRGPLNKQKWYQEFK